MKVVHPGKILRENFMRKYDLSMNELAKCVFVDRSTISRIHGELADISPEMALRLGKFFGNGPDFWIKLQNAYGLERSKKEISADLKKIKEIS